MSTYCTALSIAGSDSSGGAGIQADIKTMSALGVYAMTAITAITAQNTTGVDAVESISPQMVEKQISAVCTDIPPHAVKIGMLFSPEIVDIVAKAIKQFKLTNVVLDPVMVASSGDKLISDEAIERIKTQLIPCSSIVTPNAAEAVVLTDTHDVNRQAKLLHDMGAKAVLLKGGDKDETTGMAIDLLSLSPDSEFIALASPKVNTPNTHGTGCTLSSAIASFLARGFSMEQSVRQAKQYIAEALNAGADINIGHGHGPVNHLYSPLALTIFNTK
jgi:hydroxymethylpyrimidine/phosphomethylpyrimidine kinase